MSEEEYLIHYGIKGMHWGSRKDDGGGSGKRPSSVIGGVKKVIGSTSRGINKAKRAFSNARKNAIKTKQEHAAKRLARDNEIVRKQEEKAKLRNSKARQEALSTHDPNVLKKNMHLLTYDELNSRYKRLDLEKRVSNLVPQQTSKGKKAAEAAFKFLNSKAGQDFAKTAVDVLGKRIGVRDLGSLDLSPKQKKTKKSPRDKERREIKSYESPNVNSEKKKFK